MYGNFPKATDRKVYRPLLPQNHGYLVRLFDSDKSIPATLNNFTSFGFSLSVDSEQDETCFPGQVILIEFSPSRAQNYLIKAQVIEMERVDSKLRLSLRVMSDRFITEPQFKAIELASSHPLSGQIKHPFIYKTSSFFEVESISREEITISGIHSDFTLFDEMDVEFTLGMFQPSKPIIGKVSSVYLDDSGKIRCSLKLTQNLPKTLIDLINKYLMQYTSASPREIREAGFKVLSITEFINYRFAETQVDYETVLRTRRFAYSGVNKVDADADLEKVSYFFDDYSHILMVMHNDEIIGSATLIIGNGDDQPFEIQTFFDEKNPIQLPPADQVMEVAALCLHPDYRDTDILHGIFEQVYMLMMMLNKQYIIASSDKHLLSLYQSIGFELTPYKFVQPKYKDLEMRVLIVNEKAAQSSHGVKKMIWWPLWGGVNKHLNERRVIKYKQSQKLKAQILKWLFKTAFLIRYRRPWRG